MRVLICSQYYWPENFRINEVSRSLVDEGVEVEVLTGKPNYPEGRIFPGYRAWGWQTGLHDGITLYRLPLWARGAGGWRLALNYLSFVISGLLMAPWKLRKKRYDVIFVYAPSPILQAIPAILLAWLKGCPVVLWVQDLWPESLSATGHVKNRFILGAVRAVVRFIYRHVDLLLAQSRSFVGAMQGLAGDTPIVYFPNSVDACFAETSHVELPKLPGTAGKFTVLFAGNIGSAQAVEVMVNAAALLQDHAEISLLVLGDGSRREWMLKEVQARKLTNLHLPGKFPVETMPAFMQSADVLLVTLADRAIFRLTIPSKIQAYLAAGRPILACLNGEGAELVASAGAGIAVPAEDAHALAAVILELYRMPVAARDAMGRQGRLYYEAHFEHGRLIKELITHLRGVRSMVEARGMR